MNCTRSQQRKMRFSGSHAAGPARRDEHWHEHGHEHTHAAMLAAQPQRGLVSASTGGGQRRRAHCSAAKEGRWLHTARERHTNTHLAGVIRRKTDKTDKTDSQRGRLRSPPYATIGHSRCGQVSKHTSHARTCDAEGEGERGELCCTVCPHTGRSRLCWTQACLSSRH